MRWEVEFYHEGKELFDRISGPNGGDGMRGRIDVPGTSLARQQWCDDGLVISDELTDTTLPGAADAWDSAWSARPGVPAGGFVPPWPWIWPATGAPGAPASGVVAGRFPIK